MERGLNNRDLGTSARRVGRGAGIVAILLLSTTSLVAQSTQTTAGVDVTSQYFDRGIITENSGLILQPWISIDTPITPPAEGVGLDFHIWLANSFHTGDTGTGGSTSDDPRLWAEAEFTIGFAARMGDIESSIIYSAQTSPNGNANTVEQVELAFTFDDSNFWGAGFGGLRPSATLLVETKGQADGGGSSGILLELGIEPGLAILDDGTSSISISLPMIVGFSLDEYYEDTTGDDDFYGYFQIGLHASLPLEAFLPPHFGNWEAHAAFDLLFLGDNTRRYNNGDDVETIVTIGLSNTF